jgi:hypothetical protein
MATTKTAAVENKTSVYNAVVGLWGELADASDSARCLRTWLISLGYPGIQGWLLT